MRRSLLTAAATAALALAALALAACGGDDPAPASSSPGRRGIDAKTKQAMLAYARCMREHGTDMPDPQFDQGGGRVVQKSDLRNSTPEQLRAAEQACAKYQRQFKPPPMSAAEKQRQRQAALANARCMREHGIDMPDPQFDENGGIEQKIERGSGIDPESAQFREAEDACRDTLRDTLGPGRAESGPSGGTQ
jgi:hypothetical protein